jgi:hypothetical protein
VRFAVIIFAVLAMILGPFFGPVAAHVTHSAGIGLAVTCHCFVPPRGVRVRSDEGRTDEASTVHRGADHRRFA